MRCMASGMTKRGTMIPPRAESTRLETPVKMVACSLVRTALAMSRAKD